ncbi:hypothetical protein GH714_042697 [Hevea brasiliensis]|uniref:Uncharacterized protein n=1 Tax=Hevea brasiliensis TaxID=3981 RepID=A0A6A6K0K9_HEVBR|nr:hypothetical protein GH714_042697 [Hevea brasiliensis]
MANLKALALRIRSVRSIQKTTKVMQMISASKFRVARERLIHARDYCSTIAKEDGEHRYLAEAGGASGVLLLVFSSDKGLCGGFNHSAAKFLREYVSSISSNVGEKPRGIGFLDFKNVLYGLGVDFSAYSRVVALYSKFYSSTRQEPAAEDVLIVDNPEEGTEGRGVSTEEVICNYDPDLLSDLGRKPSDKDAEEAIEVLIRWADDSPGREGLSLTAGRVLSAYKESFQGYALESSHDFRNSVFANEGYSDMILLRGVNFSSTCEHHMSPMTGVVNVSYIPKATVIGVGAIVRVVDIFAKRLQERALNTREITDKVIRAVRSRGVAWEIVVCAGESTAVSQRLLKHEETVYSKNCQIGLRVIIDGKRCSCISFNDPNKISDLVDAAIAIASSMPEDPYISISDVSGEYSEDISDMLLFDDSVVEVSRICEILNIMEDVALSYDGKIVNSEGASFSHSNSEMVLATSNGFMGSYKRSCFSTSVSVVSSDGGKMEVDYSFSVKNRFADLEKPEVLGKDAAARAFRRLNAREMQTCKVPVLFENRVASAFLRSFAAAINGGAIADKTSFLVDSIGSSIFRGDIHIVDDPLMPGGSPQGRLMGKVFAVVGIT